MSANTLVRLVTVAALGLSTAGIAADPLRAQEGSGRISGRVLEAETGAPLAGAQVLVRGTAIGTVTDEAGRYLLLRVPSGSREVEASYLGRETGTQTVTVAEDQVAAADFQLEAVALAMDEIVVGVIASEQAEALSRQKNAPNITNIVASDQMGRFPDASAPEAVQRLPGISVARDQGEGRYIQIRGASPANTQVTINGEQVPSPEADIRQIALDAVPVDVLEAIEVSKAITPDMDAEAIGGSVNLVTRKAPEERFLAIEAASGFAPIRDELSGSGSVAYGDRSEDGRAGFLLSGSYTRRNFGSDDLEPAFDLGDPGADDDALEELAVREYSMYRARLGATANFDYRLGEGSELFATGLYSQLQDDEQRLELVNAIEDGELVFNHRNRYETQRILNLTAGGEHIVGGSVKVAYRGTFSRAEEDSPFDDEISFVREDVSFSPDIGDPDDIQANPEGGVGGEYVFNGFEPSNNFTKNRDIVGAIDITVPYHIGSDGAASLKFGAKFRDKDKDQDLTEEEFELVDEGPDIVLGTDLGTPFDLGDYNPGDYELPPIVTSENDVESFLSRFGSFLDGEDVLEAATNDYEIGERTAAGYVMTELNFSPRFMLLPGVRYEHTEVTTTGFELDPEEETLTPVDAENDYGRFFPMAHLRYELGPLTNLRAAVTTTIARPNFIDLVPFRLVDDEDITIGNPDLDPTTSVNYDLLLEHYDERIGVMSAGVFFKSLEDPIFPFTEENDLGGNTVQPRNIDSGEIRGVELALQQQLLWLPPPLDGLGIYTNYTYTDSDATLPGGRDTRLAGQSEHVFNSALSYERGGFSTQVSLNYHSDFILEFGGDTGESEERERDLIVDDHVQLDFSASYQVSPQAAVFLELVNLTNEPFVTYQGRSDRPVQEEFYEAWGELGLRYRP